MAENIRVSKIMRFAIDLEKKHFEAMEYKFYSTMFKDSDYLNYIVSSWLEQNFTHKELHDMGYDDIVG